MLSHTGDTSYRNLPTETPVPVLCGVNGICKGGGGGMCRCVYYLRKGRELVSLCTMEVLIIRLGN